MNNKTKQEFARKLQQARFKRGWNQAELARRAGMGRDNISGYESGKVLPGSKHLKKLADALGIDANSLIEGVILREETDKPMLEIKQHEEDPGMVVMRFVQVIPMPVALQIMELLKKEGK